MEASVKSAKVTLVTNSNLLCCAFLSAIVIGNLDNFQFVHSKTFIFFKQDFFLLFESFKKIIKSIAEESNEVKGVVLERGTDLYYWSVKRQNEQVTVFLSIERNFETVLTIAFDNANFNDFINVISKLILPSVCTNSLTEYILHLATMRDLKDIISFKEPESCKLFLSEIKQSEEHLITALMYYRDILILVHQMKSLINEEMEDSKIRTILAVT